MFKQLKVSINELHVDSKDKAFALYFDCDEAYLLRRAEEALKTANSGTDVEKNLLLVARLTSLARLKRKHRLLAEKKDAEAQAQTP